VRTDELIMALASNARAVRPLGRPSLRLAGWSAATLPVTALAAMAVGLRADVWSALADPVFTGFLLVTVCTAAVSAAGTLVLSVPGAERPVLSRVLPLAIGGLWPLALVAILAPRGDAAQRLWLWPFHWACLIEITGLSIVPGWILFAMLRRAAPLRRAWSGALAALAAAGIGATATQLICPLDDPAHQLVGHVLPVAALTLSGALAGHRYLNWLKRPLPTMRRTIATG
jgi:hypothetical protein